MYDPHRQSTLTVTGFSVIGAAAELRTEEKFNFQRAGRSSRVFVRRRRRHAAKVSAPFIPTACGRDEYATTAAEQWGVPEMITDCAQFPQRVIHGDQGAYVSLPYRLAPPLFDLFDKNLLSLTIRVDKSHLYVKEMC